MKLYLWFLFSFTSTCLFAWEPYKVDSSQQQLAPQSGGLDHLEPGEGNIPQSYYSGSTWPDSYLIQYIMDPALSDEVTHLIVRQEHIDFLRWEQGPRKYYLETWNDRYAHDSREKLVSSSPHVKFEIPEDLASLAYEMWANALFEVRYDRSSALGLDGWDSTFSCYIRGKGWLYGRTWTPTRELPPKWMDEAGATLVTLAKDRDIAKCRAELVRLHDKLFLYWKAHGKNS
jgi:hypothetical protein